MINNERRHEGEEVRTIQGPLGNWGPKIFGAKLDRSGWGTQYNMFSRDPESEVTFLLMIC